MTIVPFHIIQIHFPDFNRFSSLCSQELTLDVEKSKIETNSILLWGFFRMEHLNAHNVPASVRPVKVLQFGEGNFLRAFVDYMVDILNEKTDFDGSIVVVKPIPLGNLDRFHEQDCRYTVLLRGLVDGKPVETSRVITSIRDAVDPFVEYEKYAACAKEESLRFVVSNTTEAGIVLDESDCFDLCPPKSYPGKLCKFLFERAQAFGYDYDKGLIILPVELIDDNGIELKRCVKALAQKWQLGDLFEKWLDEACVFTSTLVDRIVTGYPRDEDTAIWQQLGYEDHLLVTGEPFALWVIESGKEISAELPLQQCGLPVIFTDNQKPYKQRKVRILNGAHTSFVPAAFLCGFDYVLDAMNDDLILNFMQKTLYDEVIPTLDLPKEDLLAFAESVTGRFRNPYIKHALLSICLNSVSKWRARCMPSLLAYVEREGRLPKRLAFSLAALMALYHGGVMKDGKLECRRKDQRYLLQDDAAVLSFFAKNSTLGAAEITKQFLSNTSFFGQDLTNVPGLTDYAASALEEILCRGMREVMTERFGGRSMRNALKITPQDSVAVALVNLTAGSVAQTDEQAFQLVTDVPAGHKFAVKSIVKGEPVIKYGYPIGQAREEIPQGAHVHVHNLKTMLSGELQYEHHPLPDCLTPAQPSVFWGYPRKDGKVGIRNELWILPTVGCVNDIARALEKSAQHLVREGVETVYAFPHPYGCSQMAEDQENTRQILADLATHPNAGGVLVLGLGCENSGVESIREKMGDYDARRVRFLVCQQAEDEMAEAMKLLEELAANMRPEKRVACPVNKLVIGLKCGGSDGFSGITANPVIGGFSDRLIAQGGSTILTEVPEMFGAETILMDRCETRDLFDLTVSLINDFKHYFASHGQTIYENPSPGNKAGGISTLEDKALGCTQKSGFASVKDVLVYGEKVKKQGLQLLSAPGNDLVASTALAAAGAQMVLFSTGRGTPFASPVPTMKISSNSDLAVRKSKWIDFDAGELLSHKTLSRLSDELMTFVLQIASGEKLCSEKQGFHDMAIFKTGVTL